MTTTAIVRNEIRRFLQSEEPEVILITGEWGVGKTYTWHEELRAVRAKKSYALDRYSYVSLFGANSLEALKFALIENLDFLSAPTIGSESDALPGQSVPAYAAKLLQLAPALPFVGKFFEKAGPLYFAAVRSQIICIDDLERRGDALSLKDVFGLISFLREQRACKIVLLMNVEALEEDEATFDTLFEKVIDAQLIFAPTAEEAAEIALAGQDEVGDLIRKNCIALGISNIRVIKKIERLIRQIIPLLVSFEAELTKQTVHSITLFGWSKFQPGLAPPSEFYRVSAVARYLEHKTGNTSNQQKMERASGPVSIFEYG
jgi:hypothetical protein